MSEAEKRHLSSPFPVFDTVVCSAIMLAGAWLFYDCSWARDVTPGDLLVVPGVSPRDHPLVGRYVTLRGVLGGPGGGHPRRVRVADPSGGSGIVEVLLGDSGVEPAAKGSPVALTGRVVVNAERRVSAVPTFIYVDTTRSRWTPASAAGVAIAAAAGIILAFVHVHRLRRGGEVDETARR